MGKKYTIMVIPSNSSGTRRFSITRGMLSLLLLGFCSIVGTTLYLTQERISLAKHLAKLPPLETTKPNTKGTYRKIYRQTSIPG